MGKVVSIDPREQEEIKRQAEMIEILEYLKKQVETGNIKEFVSTTVDVDGMSQIHCSTLDTFGAIGMFEIGKHILMTQEVGLN